MKLGIFLLAVSACGATPTFNSEIAPILYQNCATCHRPGQVAPFSLLTYQDAAKRAQLIAGVTGKRFMPPWKAEPGYGHFLDERRLSDAQIAMLADWAKNGAPEGDPKHKHVPPDFPAGWQAGKPDAVFTTSQAFTIPADGRDRFQCFVIPLNAETTQYVKTVEFHPGNPKVVHHALFYLDTTGDARQKDAETPEPGYPCFGGPGIALSGGLGGWAPGAPPETLPAGLAHIVEKGADLVMQIHYHPSGKTETDQSSIGLTYTGEPQKGLATMLMGSAKIDIAPGVADYPVDAWLTVPQDVDLIGINPHAHWLAKTMDVEAHLPDGKTEPLILIKDWDFNWQGEYRSAQPMKLPKGTRISMHFVYDNSAGNPRNPSSPPVRVTFGEQTTNEMAFVFLQVSLAKPEDVAGFRRAMFVSRVEQSFRDGDPSELFGRERVLLRQAEAAFDRNHDGKLDDAERAAMLAYLKSRQ